jgi:hypothetical protein
MKTRLAILCFALLTISSNLRAANPVIAGRDRRDPARTSVKKRPAIATNVRREHGAANAVFR